MSANKTKPNLDDVRPGDTVTITREVATVTDTVFDIPLPGVLDLSHFDDRFDVGTDGWTLTDHRRTTASTRRIVVVALAESLSDDVDYEALYAAADAVTAALDEAAS